MTEEGPLSEIILVRIPGIPDVITMSWIVMAVIIILLYFAARKLQKTPAGMQNAVEFTIEWVIAKSKEFMGENGPRFLPLFITLFLFIFFGNLMGLVPGLKSPTSNINITFALAIIIFCSTHYFGIKEKGLLGYLKHFAGPPYWLAPLLFPIHLIGEFIRPVSLAFRLFGNLMAKELLLGILATLFVIFVSADMNTAVKGALMGVTLVLRPLIMLLGVLVSFIQALVFTMLAMVYIAGAISPSEEHA
ncbi:MAG: F0F1 ATP synthase subunit A [Candidatus Firestonebacteria bacterium]